MKNLIKRLNLNMIAGAVSLVVVSSTAVATEIYSDSQADAIDKVVRTNNVTQIKQLVENGMDINSQFIGDGTPLMMAVAKGKRQMVEAIIGMGADVNQPSPGDGNPLIVAAMKNRLSLAEYLLDQGAELDAIVPGDETALINASRKGHFDMVRLLVEKGADVNLGVMVDSIRGSEYRSPLSMAKSAQITNYLLAAGATE